jgi:ligand-binding sensor domain-containing protein
VSIPPNVRRWFAALALGWLAAGMGTMATASSAAGSTPPWTLPKAHAGERHSQVTAGLQDAAGTLWFATSGRGVYRVREAQLTHLTTRDGLGSDTVWAMLEDRGGRVWFGTDAGLSWWDGKVMQTLPLPASTAVQPAVWSLLEDRAGTLWIGAGDGMYQYRGGQVVPFLQSALVLNPGGARLRMVADMIEDRRGNLWFASGMPPGMEGLCRFDGTTLTCFQPGGERWIRSVVEDRNGTLWLGTRHQGVWRYDGRTFAPYTAQPGLGMPLRLDRSGHVWFSGEEEPDGVTGKTGLWRYDGSTFQNFTEADGLGDYGIWSLFEDRDGAFWVGTRNIGLYRYVGGRFVAHSQQ